MMAPININFEAMVLRILVTAICARALDVLLLWASESRRSLSHTAKKLCRSGFCFALRMLVKKCERRSTYFQSNAVQVDLHYIRIRLTVH